MTGTLPPLKTKAQRLVVQGYQGCLRRNYLIQLVNDDPAATRAGTSSQAPFQQNRLTQWIRHGILPRDIFYRLINDTWTESSLHLATAPTPIKASYSFNSGASPAYAVDIGLTFEGFEALGAHPQLTDLFRKKAPAFAQGASLRAGNRLGDTGPSAPGRWGERYQKGEIHAILVVHAPMKQAGDAEAGFKAFERAVLTQFGLQPQWPNGLIQAAWIEQSTVLGNPREVHFGYVDGLTAPCFERISDQTVINQEAEFNVHQPGELLLGYEKNDKSNPWLVPGAYAQETLSTLPHQLPARIAYAHFFRDGSFGVVRKMKQNVSLFETYLSEQAQVLVGEQNLDYIKAWLKAKMLGRWPNGTPVGEAVAMTQKDIPLPSDLEDLTRPNPPKPPASNTFNHHRTDALGMACPFGAHIRRMNPRDDPVVPILRRPLLRRGAPYGQKYDPKKEDPNQANSIDRGLLGLFFCSSIEEQFEHVLGNWSNNNPMGLPYTESGKDPLVGNQDCIGNAFEIPRKTEPRLVLKDLPAFVETRGTCYAFFPSLEALKKIAAGRIASPSLFLDPV